MGQLFSYSGYEDMGFDAYYPEDEMGGYDAEGAYYEEEFYDDVAEYVDEYNAGEMAGEEGYPGEMAGEVYEGEIGGSYPEEMAGEEGGLDEQEGYPGEMAGGVYEGEIGGEKNYNDYSEEEEISAGGTAYPGYSVSILGIEIGGSSDSNNEINSEESGGFVDETPVINEGGEEPVEEKSVVEKVVNTIIVNPVKAIGGFFAGLFGGGAEDEGGESGDGDYTGGESTPGESSSSSSSSGGGGGSGEANTLTLSIAEEVLLNTETDSNIKTCTNKVPCVIHEGTQEKPNLVYEQYCRENVGYMNADMPSQTTYGEESNLWPLARCVNYFGGSVNSGNECCVPIEGRPYGKCDIGTIENGCLKCTDQSYNNDLLNCFKDGEDNKYKCILKSKDPSMSPRTYIDTDGDCKFEKYTEKNICTDGVDGIEIGAVCDIPREFQLSITQVEAGEKGVGRSCVVSAKDDVGLSVSYTMEDKYQEGKSEQDGEITDCEVEDMAKELDLRLRCVGIKCEDFGEGDNAYTICEAKKCGILVKNIIGPCKTTTYKANGHDAFTVEYSKNGVTMKKTAGYTSTGAHKLTSTATINGVTDTRKYEEINGEWIQYEPVPTQQTTLPNTEDLKEWVEQAKTNSENRRRAIAAATCLSFCLSLNTKISTPNGQINVQELSSGMLVYTQDKLGNKIIQPILKVSSTQVPVNHKVVHLILKDGRELWVSPTHPIPQKRLVEDIQIGEVYDGSIVKEINVEEYLEERTYDLLPAGDTGYYWANNILMGSTLK